MDDLDQHFMIDEDLIKRIVKYAKLKKNEIVLEIGPGKGALTRELLKKCKVTAVEKDKSLKKDLESIPNLRLNFTDAINYLKKHNDFDKIVANIPYVISEPLLNQLKYNNFKIAILTVGSTFAKKLTGKKESKLSITAPLFFDIKILEEVSKDSFTPKPRTKSAVIQLKHRTKLTKQESILKDFLKQEDKKAKNALRETLTRLGLTKKEAKTKISNLKLDMNTKNLSITEIKKVEELISTLV